MLSLLFGEDVSMGDKGIFDQNTLSSATTILSDRLWRLTCDFFVGFIKRGELDSILEESMSIFRERAQHVIEWITKGTALPLPFD